jgi:acyl-CoA thioester hydrolase
MKRVYYAKFFEYFEQGRSDLLREIGMPYPELEAAGYFLPVIEAHARYQKPALYDEEVMVKTILKDMPQARVRIEYVVTNSQTNDVLAEGYTIHSFVNAETGKPTRAPEQFLEILQESFTTKAR